ncbi:hypothetical protein GTY54_29040 [Streptomyces sp. SID625]|nr:hypothetical protein [Streptomyces sp. SID625]
MRRIADPNLGRPRRVHGDITEADQLLTEQSETVCAADHAALATAKSHGTLDVQPGVLDVCGLPCGVIERLADVVDHGHEVTVLLTDTVRATAVARAGDGS